MKRLITTAAAAALLVPAGAAARPADLHTPATKTAPVVVSAPSHDGFDWGAAGVGAAAVGGLALIAAGGFGAAYRVRMRAT
jgi:hypothetical protein